MAIARAAVGAPRIVLLDEATSALDPENERRVHERLRSLGATEIVIAHRLATVRDADRIVVMDRGTIVQQGTFEQLRATPGLFQRMAATLA
jgi:ATP-binding cassette subfamily C protein